MRSFAEAATAAGAHLTGVTIAQEQLDYAEKRAAEGGWTHQSDFQLRDFAEITGAYDAVVSIEMIESVDHDRWPELFETVAPSQTGRSGHVPDHHHRRSRLGHLSGPQRLHP